MQLTLSLRPTGATNLNRRVAAQRNSVSPEASSPVSDSVEISSPSQLPTLLKASSLPGSLGAFEVLDAGRGTLACKNLQQLKARAERLRRQGTSIIAVRHGESEANLKGVTLSGQGETPLTQAGLLQASQAAKLVLESQDFKPYNLAIYSSPLSRAHDTAKALSEQTSTAVQLDSDLMEIDFGLCEGRAIGEVVKAYPGFAKGTDYIHQFPGGESGIDVMTRVDRFLDRVEEECPGKTVVFYGHTMTVGIARILLGDVSTTEDGAICSGSKIPNAEPVKLV